MVGAGATGARVLEGGIPSVAANDLDRLLVSERPGFEEGVEVGDKVRVSAVFAGPVYFGLVRSGRLGEGGVVEVVRSADDDDVA